MSKAAFFIEIREGNVRAVSYEAATVARKIAEQTGGSAVGIAVGSGFSGKLASFGEYGISEIINIDNDLFSSYTSEGYTAAVVDAVKSTGAGYLVITGSSMGKDLAPRVAARLDNDMVPDIVDFAIADGKIKATRPVFAGKALVEVNSDAAIQFVTLRPKVFMSEKASSVDCAVTASSFDPLSVTIRAKVKEVIKGEDGKVDLTEADIIVSGGRGLQEPAHFAMLDELATAVGGVVGASRAVVDAGWKSHGDQVGQTGKTVTPKLYFAIGISGAIQHLAGMSSSKCIVAVNKDADAPIFKVADYGIVGDLFEVVPALTAELKKTLSE